MSDKLNHNMLRQMLLSIYSSSSPFAFGSQLLQNYFGAILFANSSADSEIGLKRRHSWLLPHATHLTYATEATVATYGSVCRDAESKVAKHLVQSIVSRARFVASAIRQRRVRSLGAIPFPTLARSFTHGAPHARLARFTGC